MSFIGRTVLEISRFEIAKNGQKLIFSQNGKKSFFILAVTKTMKKSRSPYLLRFKK